MSPYQKRLEELQKTFEKKVQILADKVRKEVLIPHCKKHGLCFYSGMGRFFFDKDGATITPDYAPKLVAKFELSQLFQLLELEVKRNVLLGEYISDYIPPQKREQYKKARKQVEKRL